MLNENHSHLAAPILPYIILPRQLLRVVIIPQKTIDTVSGGPGFAKVQYYFGIRIQALMRIRYIHFP